MLLASFLVLQLNRTPDKAAAIVDEFCMLKLMEWSAL
jgi:hypothetical protein